MSEFTNHIESKTFLSALMKLVNLGYWKHSECEPHLHIDVLTFCELIKCLAISSKKGFKIYTLKRETMETTHI
jgi:hypothetical protein